MRLVAMFAMYSVSTLFAAERMNVSICNQGHLPEPLIAQAETEAAIVFRSMDVEVAWAKCQDEVATEEAGRGLRFVIRLRNDHPPKASGPASLDAMGRAYVSAPNDGYIADIYYKAVQEIAERYGTDADGLLGYVIAHELGHLLLGPGHSPHGIMHAPWNNSDATAVKQRGLKFTSTQQERIHQTLQARNSTKARSN
jgi:predicted metalloprotease